MANSTTLTAPAKHSHAHAFEAMTGRWTVRCAACGVTVAALPNEAAATAVLQEHNRTVHGNPCGSSWVCGTDCCA